MIKNKQKLQRQTRVRGRMFGNAEKPRLSVFRSNNYIYAQLIDDASRVTILGLSDKQLAKKQGTRVDLAKSLGMELAKQAGEKKITTVVFDRGHYKYHGRVKAVAEGAREGGLQF